MRRYFPITTWFDVLATVATILNAIIRRSPRFGLLLSGKIHMTHAQAINYEKTQDCITGFLEKSQENLSNFRYETLHLYFTEVLTCLFPTSVISGLSVR